MRTVTLVLLTLIATNLWRAWGFFAAADVLREYGTTADPVWLAGTAILWAVAFLGLLICSGWKRSVAVWLLPVALLVYAVWMAFRPMPVFPSLIWHLALVLVAGWRLNAANHRVVTHHDGD